MNDFSIEIQDLCKTFVVNKNHARNISDLVQSIVNLRGEKQDQQKVFALQNINLSVKKGEILGIIGDNGSGKSTLMKLIAGISSPSSGSIRTRGRIASILELGTGFNYELTGYENVYFSGNLLGFSRGEIDRVIDEIAEFSELGEFMKVQVKYYSSGMFMRLAFSLIAWIDADIFLFDEVFAVGDVSFRSKCEKRILSLCDSGKTIVFVSHDLEHLTKLSNQFLVLDNGKVVTNTDSLEAVSSYLFQKTNPQQENNPISPESNNVEPLTEKSGSSGITLSRNNSQRSSSANQTDSEDKNTAKYEQSQKEGRIKCVINNVNCPHVGSVIEVYCQTQKDNLNWVANDVIQLSCSYEKLTDELVFPNFTLSYQMGAVCAAFNPLISITPESASLFRKAGKIETHCSIPRMTLNNGVFIVGLHLAGLDSKPIFSAPNLFSFQIGYDSRLLNTISYDGRFTGAFMPTLNWQVTELKT